VHLVYNVQTLDLILMFFFTLTISFTRDNIRAPSPYTIFSNKMSTTRDFIVEQTVSEKICALQQKNVWSSMPFDFLRKTKTELVETAAVNQEVYDFALQKVEEQVVFFEKQSSLINKVHSFFTAMPPEVQSMSNNYIGDTKGAAYQVICRHLDPQFNPPWTHIHMGDLPGLIVRVDTMLTQITHQGVNSPMVTDFLQTLAVGNAPFF
jgi:Cu/Zn superoxide dismutase